MATPWCARALRASLATGLIAAGIAFVPSTAALADPAPPPPATADQAAAGLSDLGHQAEVVNEKVLDGRIAVDAATADVAKADAAYQAAEKATVAARATAKTAADDAGELVVSSYQGGRTDPLMAMMTSTGPQDMLDKMSGLDWLAGDARVTLERAVTASAAADAAAANADRAKDEAARVLDKVNRAQADLDVQKKDLDAKIAVWQGTYDRLDAAEKAAYAAAVAHPEPDATEVAATSSGSGNGSAAAPVGASGGAGQSSGGGSADAPSAPAPTVSASGAGGAALQAALGKVGSPYVWGAAGPNSFDCSGLTSWAFGQAGVSIPRSSSAQSQSGTAVSQGNLQPGDLVFFYSPVSHVGIYAGDGMVVHAPTAGQSVKVAPMSQMPYNSARRY